MDPVLKARLETHLNMEWRSYYEKLCEAGFDLDRLAVNMWATASLPLKNFLVSRGQLYSASWNGYQEAGTSRCSAIVMCRVKEFQNLNDGWNGSFDVHPDGEERGDRPAVEVTRRLGVTIPSN